MVGTQHAGFPFAGAWSTVSTSNWASASLPWIGGNVSMTSSSEADLLSTGSKMDWLCALGRSTDASTSNSNRFRHLTLLGDVHTYDLHLSNLWYGQHPLEG